MHEAFASNRHWKISNAEKVFYPMTYAMEAQMKERKDLLKSCHQKFFQVYEVVGHRRTNLGIITVILNYRPIFVNFELDQCKWIDDNRYWRKGACDLVGAQRSNADCCSQQDVSCPTAISC